MKLKKRIHDLLEISRRSGDLSWYIDIFIISLILANVIALILETVEPLYLKYGRFFELFEIFSVIFFTVEYILRVWTANYLPDFKKAITGNLRYVLTPLMLIDLLAILPFYLGFLALDLRLLRALRVFRIFRVFKIARYVLALTLIGGVFVKKREELIISFLFVMFLLLVSSTLMYFVENLAQPENFSSIPGTMWWGIATLTTVGYGDIYPITPLGKFLGGMIAIIGIGLFALPAGILSSGFTEAFSKKESIQERCPSCGKALADIIDES